MSIRLLPSTFALTIGLILMAGIVQAEEAKPYSPPADTDVDDTGRNVRDRGDATLTPEDQKETRGDVKITAAIRKSIVKDKSLSLNARNAKIITRNGLVTLRGPVENQAEKQKLESIARKVAGVKQVDNQLEINAP
ncbi:BON domain-containing protein [Methylocaldum sp.]|uniref:BON domain-containing protein n=1 Tax=Methylocaldum sp. TaxID=1969727 RepID=UPI002D2CB3A6|nr:BON domain-containing protein [Methylocaldum sp.]HYE34093.1 BON domain-containing protein [Methylocaldum sp.]